MRRAYIELHIAVLLFGITAIIGRLISLDAVTLVWWRVLITAVSLLAFASVRSALKSIDRKRMIQYMLLGGVIGLHWVTFFLSIKLANVSVALVAFATQSFFTSLIEPLVTRNPVQKYEILLGLTIIPAMAFIVREVDTSLHLGIWVGIASAVLIAIFVSFTKRLITTAEPLQITFFQMTGACIFISAYLVAIPMEAVQWQLPVGVDILYILVLALLCTTLAYVFAIRSLRHLTAFTSNLTTNLEPIYGILLAVLIFQENEVLTPGFYLGAAIIITIVFSYPLVRRHFGTKPTSDARDS